MRLLSITNRYYLVLLIILLVAWSSVLYAVLKFEVYDNIDEVLVYRKNLLINNIQKDGVLPVADSYRDFVIYPIEKIPTEFSDTFQDTLVHKWRKSYDEYRRITSYFELNGESYKVALTLPHLEQDEILNTLAITLPVFFFMLLIGYSIMVSQLNRRIWKPFYEVLAVFKNFRLESGNKLDFNKSRIKEFRELQHGVEALTNKSIQVYLQQKQFTENASHEIQTPLAIIQARLELLFQDQMTEKQAEVLEQVLIAVDRLSKINEALLLLTKIENNQFPLKEKVSIRPLVETILTYFQEQASKYNIAVDVNIAENECIEANASLLSILFTNLLKNAFVHNLPNGMIELSIRNNLIEIINTGNPLRVTPEKLFERFYSQSSGRGGVGLGLALVKAICNLNQWGIAYTQSEGIHKISVAY